MFQEEKNLVETEVQELLRKGAITHPPTGRHPLVTSLMKGIGNSHPLTSQYIFIWDTEQVLKHISSFHPNDKLDLKLEMLPWFLPPPFIIMGELNLKICQNFVFRNSQHPEK